MVMAMQPRVIQEHQRKRPFRPFRICLDDGTSCEVRDPANMLVGSGLVFIGVQVDQQGIPDHFEVWNAAQVTRIEILPELRQGQGA
jgi:hypothetical protein